MDLQGLVHHRVFGWFQRLELWVLVAAASCVAACSLPDRVGCGEGGCLAGPCATLLPIVLGCRVKLLGLGEPCGDRRNSTRLTLPICGRSLHCDPETKTCAPLPTSAAATFAASNATEPSTRVKSRCVKRGRGYRCYCWRSRRPKSALHRSRYHTHTNPNLHWHRLSH